MRRRQVVLPEPEGPSMEKNSPSSMARLTPATALTAPKWRLTSRSSTATLMSGGARLGSAPHDGDVVGDPLAVGHAGALLALGRRRAPEVDLVEAIEAV